MCDRPGGAVCLAIPRGTGVNPYLVVEVNGKGVAVSPGTDLRGLLTRTLRISIDRVLPTLTVTRTWNGKPATLQFDRASQDVLGLVLTGRESLRWQVPSPAS